MPALLKFFGSVERDPAIDAWIDAQPADLRTLARTWFEHMRALE